MVEQTSGVFLDKDGNPKTLEEIAPQKNIIYSVDGTPLPIDITNKTVEELRNLGFTDVLSYNVKHDPVSGGAKPVLDPEEKRRVIDMANQIKQDMNDPEYHLDTLGDPIDENQSLDRPKN
jgi:hypothetical protein